MLIAALLVLVLLTILATASGQTAPPLQACLGLAVLATALEQWSVFGIDNLSVPVLTGMLWSQWSG
jgi:dolichol kinase